jgi:hypothetical protein
MDPPKHVELVLSALYYFLFTSDKIPQLKWNPSLRETLC